MRFCGVVSPDELASAEHPFERPSVFYPSGQKLRWTIGMKPLSSRSWAVKLFCESPLLSKAMNRSTVYTALAAGLMAALDQASLGMEMPCD